MEDATWQHRRLPVEQHPRSAAQNWGRFRGGEVAATWTISRHAAIPMVQILYEEYYLGNPVHIPAPREGPRHFHDASSRHYHGAALTKFISLEALPSL